MHPTTRRTFVKGAISSGIAAAGVVGNRIRPLMGATNKQRDIRIESVSVDFEESVFRSPFKFAQTIVERQTMSTAKCSVRTADGKTAKGFGVLPLNYTFTFPSKVLSHQDRLNAMRALAEELVSVTSNFKEFGHPIDIYWDLAKEYEAAASRVSKRLALADPIPRLCTLVTAAAIDAAIHDAYGKVHGVSSFQTYGPEFMNRDLSHYLGANYRGEYPSQYLLAEPKTRMPLCHLISAVDPIVESENARPLRDGLPETIPDWIRYNGLTYFKIKLNGDDLRWDIERMLHIHRVIEETQKTRGVERWTYIPDFNEKCPNVDYYLAFLRELKEKTPTGFQRIEYVEQPTHRDLKGHPENDMHAAAKLCQVVIDESVIDVESVLTARQQGWTGVVVKSPKGLTHMLFIAAVAGKLQMRVAGGDMTCPGAALVQTTGLQARLSGVTSIEANARQFLPAANRPWESRFPGIFRITDGMLRTSELIQPGLGVNSLDL